SRAPHQANHHRYYKRSNFESKPMEDYEVRDLMRRSIEYGKKYAASWDLLVEIQRLQASIHERGQIQGADWLLRSQLAISISSALRSSGSAVVLLPKSSRNELAEMISKLDEYNALIETERPGAGDKARMDDHKRKILSEAFSKAVDIAAALR